MSKTKENLIDLSEKCQLKLEFDGSYISIYDHNIFLKKVHGFKKAYNFIYSYRDKFKKDQAPYKLYASDIAKRHNCEIDTSNNMTVYTYKNGKKKILFNSHSYKKIYEFFKKIEEGQLGLTKLKL